MLYVIFFRFNKLVVSAVVFYSCLHFISEVCICCQKICKCQNQLASNTGENRCFSVDRTYFFKLLMFSVVFVRPVYVLKAVQNSFRNRTSLFKDQISTGNASLQLTGVKVQDEGTYQCCTSTMTENDNSFINVKVDAPVHDINIQQVENRITCSSGGIYPQPELTWSTTPPSNINLLNSTTVQQNEQQLYSISSSLILSPNDTDLLYSCTISTPTNRRRAAWRKLSEENISSQQSTHTLLTCFILVFFSSIISAPISGSTNVLPSLWNPFLVCFLCQEENSTRRLNNNEFT
uniref:Ig-like domain-containing protein n=1 Tax=Amphiprion percula TaxID=161767 RepID=A0A3P8RXQ1_AMPPE